ncbi:hypothetical protein AKJ16_DCAP09782 [Drosera capensis]
MWNSLKLFCSFRMIKMNEIFFVNDMKVRFCWVARVIEVSGQHNNANSARNVMFSDERVRSTRGRISLNQIFSSRDLNSRTYERTSSMPFGSADCLHST